MSSIRIWRWSRLKERNAWKKIADKSFLALAVLALVTWCLTTVFADIGGQYLILISIVVTLAIVSAFLVELCTPDEFVTLKGITDPKDAYINKSECDVYVYKVVDNIYEVLVKHRKDIAGKKVVNNEYRFQTTKFTTKINGRFLYKDCKCNKWSIISANGKSVELGACVEQNVFISNIKSKNKSSKVSVKILDNHYGCGFDEIEADSIFTGNQIYTYQKLSQTIRNTDIEVNTADEYVFIKNGPVNILIGLYFSGINLENPYFLRIKTQAFVLCEVQRKTLYKYDDNLGRYKISYKCDQNYSRTPNGVFLVMDGGNKLNGVAYIYVPDTHGIMKVYEGPIYCIDFNEGHIFGKDGLLVFD